MANLPPSVEELFEAALDLPPENRPAYLDRACRNQPLLRRMTEELLAEEERAGSFLAHPLFASSVVAVSPTTRGNGAVASNKGSLHPVTSRPRFTTGDILAHRFVVVRFLARGGMGEVYEVEDLWLHGEHVALKVIRPEIAADELHSRRFEQEVVLARKVVHANLCPIYEIFRCDDPAPPFLFLTMKLLVGATLATRLRQAQSLSRAERELICTELLRAVAALHAGGIIHRDIKPGNIMLESTTSPFRVALMDFGLARLREADPTVFPGLSDLNGGAAIVAGTPGYLAPELLRGEPPNEASDLFALGVVLHQILTDSRPAASHDGLSVQVSSSLRSSDVSGAFIRLVEGLLAANTERRQRAFQHAIRSQAERVPSRVPLLLSRRSLAISAGAALCSLAAGTVWKRNVVEDLLHPLPSRRFVALLSWPPGSDQAVRSTLSGVLDAIANELTRAEAFDREFYIAPPISSEVSTPAQLDELRQSLGANLVLAASGTIRGSIFHLLLQIMEPSTHQMLRSRALEIACDRLLSLPAEAVRAATELLDLHRFRPDDRRSHVGTDNPEALAAFQAAQTLRKQPNDTGMDAAIEKYKLAVDLDPHFAEAFARLSGTYLHLYKSHFDRSLLTLGRANAETALVLDPESVQGHAAMGAFFIYTGLAANALDQVARALAIDPTNVQTMLLQAQIYTGLNRWGEAEQSYRRYLRARPNDWSGYNNLGYTYNSEGRYPQALEAFQAAAAAAPNRAICFCNIGLALFQLGRFADALANVDKSLSLSRSEDTLLVKTHILHLLGRHAEALQTSLEAVKLTPQDGMAWLELGDSYAMLGHAGRQAAQAYERATVTQTALLESNPADGPGWMMLALCRIKAGDAAGAPPLLDRAETLHAADIDSQLIKLRIQELLSQRDAALQTLTECVHRGATRYQLDATVDLASLRSDPRYSAIVDKTTRADG